MKEDKPLVHKEKAPQQAGHHLIPPLAEIVAAYLHNHRASLDELEEVMDRIHAKLNALGGAGAAAAPAVPNVDIASSITPDYIICLEDGKKLKMLKRYLKTNFDMTPEDYRKRWNLPTSYPMVAPNYAKKRSRLAKEIGLGKKGLGARTKASRAAEAARAKTAESAGAPKTLPKVKGELPKGKGKLSVVKSTDVMKANVR